jgi:hypothetical protein
MVVLWEENHQFGKEIRSRISVFSSDTCERKDCCLLIGNHGSRVLFILKIPLPPPPVFGQVIHTKDVRFKGFKTLDLLDTTVDFAGFFEVLAPLKFANKSEYS